VEQYSIAVHLKYFSIALFMIILFLTLVSEPLLLFSCFTRYCVSTIYTGAPPHHHALQFQSCVPKVVEISCKTSWQGTIMWRHVATALCNKMVVPMLPKKKKKTKKRKDRNYGRQWLYCLWKKSIRWPLATGCGGDGHGCVTLCVCDSVFCVCGYDDSDVEIQTRSIE